MSGLRHSLPLLLVAGLACTGRVEPPAAPVAQPSGQAPSGAPAAGAPPVDPADALAATLTEEKLQRLLLVEEEILPVFAQLVALASTPGAERRSAAPGEPTREERTRRLEGQIDAALAKRALTRADHSGFAALSGGLVQRTAKAAAAREQLARNADAKNAAARRAAEASRKRPDPRRPRPPEIQEAPRPLPAGTEQALQVQIVQADADRKAFAARHGEAVLGLIDRYQPQILAVREKQVRIVLGASSSR